MTSLFNRQEGFSLVEVMLVVALVAIIAVASIDVVTDTVNETRFHETLDRMHAISKAMIGDATLKENGARTSFGFMGDIGALPSTISELITNTWGFSSWAINSSVGFGIGWNGPYLSDQNSATNYTTDAWGNAFVYSTAGTPSITSYGADGVAGGTGYNQDIVIDLPTTMTTATTVSGYVTNHYSAYTGSVTVQLNTVSAGALSQVTYNITDGTGYFTFSNVPFGTRSIQAFIGTSGNYTQTVPSSLPLLITVDKPNYTIPPGSLDINP